MPEETSQPKLRFLSITPEKSNYCFADEDLLKASPTRVLDFPEDEQDAAVGFQEGEMKLEDEEESGSSDEDLNEEDDGEDESVESPPVDIKPPSKINGSIYRKSDSRRQRNALRVLPTLDETSSCSSGDLEDSGDLSDSWSKLDYSSSDFLLSSSDRVDSTDSLRKKSRQPVITKPRSYCDRIEEMEAKALHLAETGCEEKSITLFRKLIKRNAAEVSRIKDRMTQAEGKHIRAMDSIHTRLREDWSKVSLSTGFVHMCLANLYERLGNYKKALSACREAVETYRRHALLVDVQEDGSSVQDLAREAEKVLEKMKAAQASFEERRNRQEGILALRAKMATTGDTSLMSQVEEMSLHAKDMEVKTLGEDHPQVADSCILLSELAQERGDLQKALRLAMEALGINKGALGESHPQTGNTLLHIARLHDATNSDEAALDYYNRSLKVMQPLKASQSMVGSILNDVAIIYIRQGRLDQAIEKLKDALASYGAGETNETTVSVDNMSLNCELVQVWRNLGECFFQKKEYVRASESLVSALNLQRDIRRTRDGANQDQLGKVAADLPVPLFATDASIAETLRRLGRSYRGQGMFQEAITVLREAILIHRMAVAKAISNSKNGMGNAMLPEKQDELANSLYCLAEVCADAKDLAVATKLFGDSLQLRLFSDANRPGARRNLVHCAMCLVGMANIHMMKNEYKDAHKVYSDALSYCDAHGVPEHNIIRKMITDKIQQADIFQSEKIEADEQAQLDKLEREVDVQLKQGKLDRAIGTLTRIMAIRRALLKLLKSSGRDSSKVRYDTACVLQKFGDALAKKGDKKHAERAYADSLKLFKKAGVSGRRETVAAKLEMIRQHMV